MEEAEKGYPYEGAKEQYILDVEDTDHAKKVIELLETLTPIPKPKKSKK